MNVVVITKIKVIENSPINVRRSSEILGIHYEVNVFDQLVILTFVQQKSLQLT